MTKLTLYSMRPSAPARAVQHFLRYLELDVDVKIVDGEKREQFSESFLKMNPAHQVPVLKDGDFALSESRAILQYLANAYKPGSHLYPTDPKARARVDQRLSYDHVLFDRTTAVYRPIAFGGQKQVPPQVLKFLVESIKVIDTYLKESKWIAGENLTIADFSALSTVTTIVALGYDIAKHSNLNRWYKQCQSLKGFEENQKGGMAVAKLVKLQVDEPILKAKL